MSSFLVSMLQAADPQLGGRRDVSVADVLDAGAVQARSSFADDARIQAQMLGTIAQTDYTLGRFREGAMAADGAVRLLSDDTKATPQLADALRLEGKLLNELGDRAQAAAQLGRALALLQRVSYSERAQASVMKELGMTLLREADPGMSEMLYREAIRIFGTLRVDDPEYGDTLISLGELLLRKGAFAEALAVEQRGLDMMLRHQTADNPDVLGARLAVAEALESLGRYADAEPMLRELLDKRIRVLGARHLDTSIARLSLSANLRMQQRFEEAIATADRAAADLDPVIGDQHSARLFSLSMRGLAHCLGGNAAQGLEMIAQAARIRVARFGDNDRRAALGRALLTLCEGASGRHSAALHDAPRDSAWRALAYGSYADVPQLMDALAAANR